MPRIEVDDRGSSGLSRMYRALFIISVFVFLVVPFLDDALLIRRMSSSGTLDTTQMADAIRVSMSLHGAQFMFHILACTVGVGMVIWQAQREDSSTFFVAPALTAIAVGLSAIAGRIIPAPEVSIVTKAVIGRLEGGEMHHLAMNFGMIGIQEFVIITAILLGLAGFGFSIKRSHDAQDADKNAQRGQKPEGWGS